MKPAMKIGYILLSNSRNPIPSTRIAALNIFPLLRAAGFDPRIIYEPVAATEVPDIGDISDQIAAEGIRIVVFQKVHGSAIEALATALRARNIRTIYAVCDLVNIRMTALTDATIVVTDFLRTLYPAELHHKIHVVHDGIEHPEIEVLHHREDRGSSATPLRAVLVTSAALDHLPVLAAPPPWLEVEIIGRYPAPRQRMRRIRTARWTFNRQKDWTQRVAYLRFLANPRIRRIPWHPEGVYERLQQADIGILPIDRQPPASPGATAPNWQVKSENRLTMKMCIGLPVIATPIPSYEPVIEHGCNGYLASNHNAWRECLETLRNPDLRKSMGNAARQSVLERYSLAEQARLFIAVLDRVRGG
jgi:hypothetical protein